MKTKPTFTSYVLVILILALISGAISFFPKLFTDPYYDDKMFPKIFLPSILTLSIFFLLMGELKNKCLELTIHKDEIIVKRFWGIKTDIYKTSKLNGWKLSHQNYNHKDREFIFLYLENKKIATLTEIYHKNYYEIKTQIESRFEYLGYEKFSYTKDFKEMLEWK